MTPVQYYFDTFALVERTRGKSSYAPYAEVPVFSHQANVYEFVAWLLRTDSESVGREVLRRTAINLLEADTDDLFAAARLKLEKRVSYVGALGYVLARKNGMRFLTGDKAFEGADGVEYVR